MNFVMWNKDNKSHPGDKDICTKMGSDARNQRGLTFMASLAKLVTRN